MSVSRLHHSRVRVKLTWLKNRHPRHRQQQNLGGDALHVCHMLTTDYGDLSPKLPRVWCCPCQQHSLLKQRSRRFRMMEFNENWSRKEKYAKSFSYCFMGIYRDKAPYITTRTLTGVLCISLCPPCTLWLLGSGPPQYRYRNSGAGCGAAPLPPRDAGHGLCSCLPRLHSGFVGAYVALEF